MLRNRAKVPNYFVIFDRKCARLEEVCNQDVSKDLLDRSVMQSDLINGQRDCTQEKSNKSCLKVLVELSCVSNVVKIFVISKYHQNRYISPLPSQESKNVLKKNFNWWRSKLISEANHVFVGKLSVQLHLQSRRKRELNINISQSQLIVCLVTRVMQMLT